MRRTLVLRVTKDLLCGAYFISNSIDLSQVAKASLNLFNCST
jgi:hypothetical protein